MAYLEEIVLREVPRGEITKQLEEAARRLAPDPGPGLDLGSRLKSSRTYWRTVTARLNG